MEFKKLRKKYPQFVYENYSYKISKKDLRIVFDFRISPNIKFTPKIIIKNIDQKRIAGFDKKVLDNLVFHLGLIELLSYWKATCSPEIIIKAGFLNKEQIKWWKDLIINGMGQFFYENKINFRQSNFLKILPEKTETRPLRTFKGKLKDRVLVPIGGGKDSIVTWEILRGAKLIQELNCFSLNPSLATQKVMRVGKCKNSIIVKRKIDKKLLELNRKGFLNGHTPFSAYLAFLTILVGVIFDYQYIAFSNERSSNEGNVKYLGKIINHQYSKSFDFEKRFRNYSKKHLVKNLPAGRQGIEYFSFLRPLYEIQISELFSYLPEYFPVFLSCNQAHQTDSGKKKPIGKWCNHCPKCLFVFMSLYPFIETKKLIRIFGKNLFEDKKLLSIMQELIGEKRFKPFECVGTQKESLTALYLGLKKDRDRASIQLPFLLSYFEKKILPKYPDLEKESKKILNSWNKQHNIPSLLTKKFNRLL